MEFISRNGESAGSMGLKDVSGEHGCIRSAGSEFSMERKRGEGVCCSSV